MIASHGKSLIVELNKVLEKQCSVTEDEKEHMSHILYSNDVGNLIPDLAHLILRYLKDTSHFGLLASLQSVTALSTTEGLKNLFGCEPLVARPNLLNQIKIQKDATFILHRVHKIKNWDTLFLASNFMQNIHIKLLYTILIFELWKMDIKI
ncbi:hypothetical protein ACJX0J_032930 [Zea mays]